MYIFFKIIFTCYKQICLFLRANGDWQCLLCKSVEPVQTTDPTTQGLSETEMKTACRLILEIYCQYDASLNLRQPVPPQVEICLFV